MNEFVSWCRHLLVSFLFHALTSLHPPSFHRNDFSTCNIKSLHCSQGNGRWANNWFIIRNTYINGRLSLIGEREAIRYEDGVRGCTATLSINGSGEVGRGRAKLQESQGGEGVRPACGAGETLGS